MSKFNEPSSYLSEYINWTKSCMDSLENIEKGKGNREDSREILLQRFHELAEAELHSQYDSTISVLIKNYGIPMPILLFLIISLAFELDQTLLFQYRKNFNTVLPNFHYTLLLLGTIYDPDYDILNYLSDSQSILWHFFEQCKDSDVYVLEYPMIMKKKVLHFLISGELLLNEGVTYYSFFDDETRYLEIHEEALSKIEIWKEIPGVHMLYGKKGSGKKTLLFRYCKENEKTMLLLDSNLYFTDELLHDSGKLQELLFFHRITNSLLCIYNMNSNRIREYHRLLWYMDGLAPFCYVLTEEIDCYKELTKEIKKCSILPDWLDTEENELAWKHLFHSYLPKSNYFSCPARVKYTIGEWMNKFETAYLLALEEGLPCIEMKHITESLKKQEASSVYGEILNYPYQMTDFIGEEQTREMMEQIIFFAKNRDSYLKNLNNDFRSYYGKGFIILFHGPSGTGKTMAASIIAWELHMPLYRADLSRVQDKYIGETEKHLDEIFFTAIQNNCILFFDEADALFSKRTKVDSSHDKYANSATSYLLQKLESHEGIIILATNLLDNFDDAFLRRIHYMIRLSKPDKMLREKLWRSFFKSLNASDSIPYPALSALDNFNPARMKETALSAFLFACQDDKKMIEPCHIRKAIQYEFRKEGRSLPPDFLL